MADSASAMDLDGSAVDPSAAPAVQAPTAPLPTPRPTPRKLPKFPIDLQMPLTVYWPESDDKIIVWFEFLVPVFLASEQVFNGVNPNHFVPIVTWYLEIAERIRIWRSTARKGR